jgi:hypothetical protein
MEEALVWLRWLEPIDAKIVWLRSNREPWKTVCWTVGLARAAANEHHLYALCLIAWRLNGWHRPSIRSRRYLIGRTRERRARPNERDTCDPWNCGERGGVQAHAA